MSYILQHNTHKFQYNLGVSGNMLVSKHECQSYMYMQWWTQIQRLGPKRARIVYNLQKKKKNQTIDNKLKGLLLIPLIQE